MKTAVTACLVSQARNGPFVFHDGLADACSRAAHIGFDAVEIFPRSADAIDCAELAELLAANHLAVAAIGTGAGWLVDRMSLTSPDEDMRLAARHYIASNIRLGGRFGAPAIIGSMQGKLAEDHDRELAYDWLGQALDELGELAASLEVPLLLEPLNRYETNLFNRLEAASNLVNSLKTKNVRLLADLFHMNIEEPDLACAVRSARKLIGHVHFADSNRQAVGYGHLDVGPVISALQEIGYTGYLSAEIFPLPTADAAAQQTMAAIRRYVK